MIFNAVIAHSGFDGLVLNDKKRLSLGRFHHQLHHRHFECNYGNAEMPWDKWFKTFHDGSDNAMVDIRKNRIFPNNINFTSWKKHPPKKHINSKGCLLYTSDAADE